MKQKLAKIVLTGLGTGYLPIAPGTWGAAAVCGLFLLTAWGSGGMWYCVSGTMAVIILLAAVGCVAFGKTCEQVFGKKDPSRCTIDEWAGQAITFILLPLGCGINDWLITAATAFFAFRLFDVLKITPAREMEKLPYGWGVLMDDVIAGIQANIVCQVALRLVILQNLN